MRVEINKWNGIRAIRWKRKEREKRDMGEEGVKEREKKVYNLEEIRNNKSW